MKHIRVITPHTTPRPRKLEEVAGLVPDSVARFSHVGLTNGPASIESVYDEAISAPYVIEKCVEAELAGVDAVIVDCMGDPGVEAARDVVSIPVLGPGETSMHVAAMTGHKYGVVTISDRVRPIFERHARVYGTHEALANVRSVDVSVVDLGHDDEALIEALFRESIAVIDQDRADVIILGCTGFLGVSEQLQSRLSEAGRYVPVINPLRATAMMALTMSTLGLGQRRP